MLHFDTEHRAALVSTSQQPRSPDSTAINQSVVRLNGEGAGTGAFRGAGESDLPFKYESSLITPVLMELQPV